MMKGKSAALEVQQVEGEEPGVVVARKLNSPFGRHGIAATEFQGQVTAGLPTKDQPSFMDYATV